MFKPLTTLPRQVWLITALFVALTTLPYLVALSSTPSGGAFSGAIVDNVDFYSHMAKMQQGMRGEWRYRILFTGEPHEGAYLQLFYVALGHVARWTGLSAPLTYHLARILFTILMVIALWYFARRFLSERVATWTLFLCLLSGGFGFLLYLVAPDQTQQISPIELWLIDAYMLFSAFTFPHFAAAIGLLALIFLNADRWTRDGARWALAWVVSLSLLLGIIQPFHLLLVGVVVSLVAAARVLSHHLTFWRAALGIVLLGSLSAAWVGYQWAVLHQDAVFRSFSDQNLTLSPPPIYYGLGFAPLLIPAGFGLVRALRIRNERLITPLIWLVSAAALVYLPVTTQRRFTLAVQLPMAVLAVYWLAEVALPAIRRRFRRRYRSVALVYIGLAVLSSIIVYVTWIGSARKPANYYDVDSLAAWEWIRQNTATDALFFTTFEDGGQLVANTGRRAVIGHWYETMDYWRKQHEVDQFYTAVVSDEWRRDWLSKASVDYFWDDSRVKADWSPRGQAYLSPLFSSGAVTIYKVQH